MILNMIQIAIKKQVICDPAGVRTQDPQIKSLLLYQLSYGVGLAVVSE